VSQAKVTGKKGLPQEICLREEKRVDLVQIRRCERGAMTASRQTDASDTSRTESSSPARPLRRERGKKKRCSMSISDETSSSPGDDVSA